MRKKLKKSYKNYLLGKTELVNLRCSRFFLHLSMTMVGGGVKLPPSVSQHLRSLGMNSNGYPVFSGSRNLVALLVELYLETRSEKFKMEAAKPEVHVSLQLQQPVGLWRLWYIPVNCVKDFCLLD
jgi:hypothetical protein